MKERINKYQREYYQRPEVKKRIRIASRAGRVPVTDCLRKEVPIPFTEILARSGAGRTYARNILASLVKMGVVTHVKPDSYSIVPSNPLRYALNGYYRDYRDYRNLKA